VDAKFVKEYRKRLGIRVTAEANAKAPHLPLPLQLQSYVPPKLLLKDYQIDGEACYVLHACQHHKGSSVTCRYNYSDC
jgi:hypothetical protein